MLAVRGVQKSYGDVAALQGVELNVGKGEIVCLLGLNGAGKTTLVSIIAGLLRPDAGTVFLGDVDVRAAPERGRALVGIAPQETGVYPPLTVRENMRLFGRLADVPARTLEQRIEEVAGRFQLSGLLERLARHLSGGEKRRLHTAVAFLHSPPILLLDEPTVGADVPTRNAILSQVRRIADEGATVLYSTHYLPEVEALEARVAVLDRGAIVADGQLADVLGIHSLPIVELNFTGPAPTSLRAHGFRLDGNRAEMAAESPGLVVKEALTSLTAQQAEAVDAVRVVRPSLETVFAQLVEHEIPEESGDAVAP